MIIIIVIITIIIIVVIIIQDIFYLQAVITSKEMRGLNQIDEKIKELKILH